MLAVVRGRRFAQLLSEQLEYVAFRSALALLGGLPRFMALRVGEVVGRVCFRIFGRLRRVGLRNLELAFPAMSRAEGYALLLREYEHLGRQVADCAHMSRWSRAEADTFIRYDGLDRFLAAEAKGKGVLVLTAHLGAWELSSFYHSLAGHPMGMVVRRLDNARIEAWVNGVRCRHGNRTFHKDDFARALLAEMRSGRTVGILMDTNMTPPQGVFVPFFGKQACTASGLARVSRKTGAAVLPGFLLAEGRDRYVLHFGEEIEMVCTEDAEADALENTGRLTAVLEHYIARYPDQWLWMHRRWKTRPPGEGKVYS